MASFVPKYPMAFGTAERLGVITHYRFFTPALLYLFGGFRDYILEGFLETCKTDVRFLHYRFRQPLFSGMSVAGSDDDWNHVLWAVLADAYPAFESFMCSVAMIDPSSEQQAVRRICAQYLTIADPLYVERQRVLDPATVPMLPITVFGMDGSDAVIALSPDTLPMMLPEVIRLPPEKATRRFARLALDGQDPTVALAMPPQEVPAVLPTLDVRDISDVSAEKQAEVLRTIERYKHG